MNTSELFRRERPTEKPGTATKRVRIELDPAAIKPITPEEHRARLAALEIPDDKELDFSDIPKMDEEQWRRAVKVRNPWMVPPTKTTLEKVKVDSDIIFWILNQVGEEGYQDKLNTMLRRAMEEERARAGK